MAAYLKTIDTAALANLSRVLVGVDRILNSKTYNVNASSNYPPHNIAKYSETSYGIEVAVAGFSKDEIDVEVDQNIITVRGEHFDTDESVEYLYKGLASRNFLITFPLAEYMEVRDASVNNGMLKITVEYVVPEALKPRRIEIK